MVDETTIKSLATIPIWIRESKEARPRLINIKLKYHICFSFCKLVFTTKINDEKSVDKNTAFCRRCVEIGCDDCPFHIIIQKKWFELKHERISNYIE